jgi:hypothetical protein
MKRLQLLLFLLSILLQFTLIPLPAAAQAGSVQGGFCSQAQGNSPAPGLLVSLVHPQFGRSAPVFTDNYGNFFMANIPMSPVPYYIEVYWGSNLIYRSMILVGGQVQLQRVCL